MSFSPSSLPPPPMPPPSSLSLTPSVIPEPYCEASVQWEERVWMVRQYYEAKGYRVHSGLQFGCELVLYADEPGRVHSDFCVHVVPEDGLLDWRMMQSLVRSMPDLHKTLILANPTIVAVCDSDNNDNNSNNNNEDGTKQQQQGRRFVLQNVQEMAFATEHAPFRHRKARGEVGSQRKKTKTGESTSTLPPSFSS